MTGGWGTASLPGDLSVGETFVAGKNQETARELLAATKDLGLDSGLVRAVNGGFIVPDAVWDQTQENRASATSSEF